MQVRRRLPRLPPGCQSAFGNRFRPSAGGMNDAVALTSRSILTSNASAVDATAMYAREAVVRPAWVLRHACQPWAVTCAGSAGSTSQTHPESRRSGSHRVSRARHRADRDRGTPCEQVRVTARSGMGSRGRHGGWERRWPELGRRDGPLAAPTAGQAATGGPPVPDVQRPGLRRGPDVRPVGRGDRQAHPMAGLERSPSRRSRSRARSARRRERARS